MRWNSFIQLILLDIEKFTGILHRTLSIFFFCEWKLLYIYSDFTKMCSHWPNRQYSRINEFQKCRRPLRPVANQRGVQNRQPSVLYVFEHKTKHILIHAAHTGIVAFRHISDTPPRISQSQNCYNTPILYTAAIFVNYCYTTDSWLFC